MSEDWREGFDKYVHPVVAGGKMPIQALRIGFGEVKDIRVEMNEENRDKKAARA